jgi:hypothetical protein
VVRAISLMTNYRTNPMDPNQHQAIYGELDPFAVAPFMSRYGDPLSAEGRRLACKLQRALTEIFPGGWAIRVELAQFLSAGFEGRRYDKALHRQKLIALLERV